MQDPIKEDYNKLIFWLDAGKADPGSPTYEEARNKLTVKLAVAMINAIGDFRTAMEASARQAQTVNVTLVRLTWVLVGVGLVTVAIAVFR